MRREFLKTIAAAAMVAGAMTLAGGEATAQQKMKVGFIYVGPVGDFGWSYQHDEGRKASSPSTVIASRRPSSRASPKVPTRSA